MGAFSVQPSWHSLTIILATAVFLLRAPEVFPQISKSQQEKQKLEKEREKLLKEIELTKKLLEKTEQNKKQTLSQLEILQKQIETRQKVIVSLNKEIRLLNREIEEKQEVVHALQNDLKELKKQYAELLVNAYKNRNALNEIVFIFSARDFNDAFQRIKLIQTINQFRKRQAELIEITRKELDASIAELKKKKAERMKLLNAEIAQRTELNQEKNEQSKLAQELKKKESNLARQLKQKQADADRLSRKIEEIIRKEIEAARKKAETDAKAKSTPAPSKSVSPLSLTPESARLSAEFYANQGKLPWPVEKGFISREFGQQPHPLVKNVVINNRGIDIRTEKNAKARAVFEGTVTSIVTLPGMQKTVIVRHGEYFTVYANLEEVFVKAGQQVTLKQELGIIHTSEEDDKTEIHFEIWKDAQTMNPAGWIAR
jgi:septal ring factor EnvC (AmiA/AmiB activator)